MWVAAACTQATHSGQVTAISPKCPGRASPARRGRTTEQSYGAYWQSGFSRAYKCFVKRCFGVRRGVFSLCAMPLSRLRFYRLLQTDTDCRALQGRFRVIAGGWYLPLNRAVRGPPCPCLPACDGIPCCCLRPRGRVLLAAWVHRMERAGKVGACPALSRRLGRWPGSWGRPHAEGGGAPWACPFTTSHAPQQVFFHILTPWRQDVVNW